MAIGVGASEPRSSSISQEVEQHCVVIKEVNPPSEMRRVVLPSELPREQPAVATSNSPLVPLNPERPMVKMAKLAQKTTERKRTLTLVTHPVAAAVVFEPETTPPTTPMPIQASITTSQDIAATPTTAKTLLLLTSAPHFDRTATPACFVSAKSLESNSHHTKKLPSGAPSNAKAFPYAVEVQMDLLLANQHMIIANQTKLQAH